MQTIAQGERIMPKPIRHKDPIEVKYQNEWVPMQVLSVAGSRSDPSTRNGQAYFRAVIATGEIFHIQIDFAWFKRMQFQDFTLEPGDVLSGRVAAQARRVVEDGAGQDDTLYPVSIDGATLLTELETNGIFKWAEKHGIL